MFDPSAARTRLERLWRLKASFGFESGNNRIFLDEIVSDRLQLISGLQVLRDELQFATPPAVQDRDACAADLSQPSVVTTLAYTNCGDRIHHDETENYQRVVGSRFATITEIGRLKPEAFHPTGGGTDDGATLAHVTWAHALDDNLRHRVYEGNSKSFVLCAFDLKTHVGRDLEGDRYGYTRESKWREARAACGAVVGTLSKYDPENMVHRRIRGDLGDKNFELLSKKKVMTTDGVDITAVVAAAIICVQGLHETANALKHEMDDRGFAHLTASITVNRPGMPDTGIYLARATVFDGELRVQGFGLDASKYSGSMVQHRGEQRLRLTYDGMAEESFERASERYKVRDSVLPGDIYA